MQVLITVARARSSAIPRSSSSRAASSSHQPGLGLTVTHAVTAADLMDRIHRP